MIDVSSVGLHFSSIDIERIDVTKFPSYELRLNKLLCKKINHFLLEVKSKISTASLRFLASIQPQFPTTMIAVKLRSQFTTLLTYESYL